MDIQTSASRPASGPSFDNYTRRPLRTVTECAQSLVDSVASTSAAEDAERLPPRFYLIPINKHVQAHQKAEGIPPAVIVNHRIVDDQATSRRQCRVALRQEY